MAPSSSAQGPPPKPPKPLHLTMSLRHRPAAGKTTSTQSSYPRMPRWSTAESDEGGTVRERNWQRDELQDERQDERHEKEEAAAATSSLKALFPPPDDGQTALDVATLNERTRRQQSSGDYRTARGGSTIRAKRASIFFNPIQPNPLQPPSAATNAEQSDEELLAAAEGELSEASPTAIDELLDPISSPAPSSDSPLLLDLPPTILSAVAIHAFEGESAFGELSFPRGAELRIEVDDLGGNWSLGYLASEGEAGRGLIPRGFVAYVEEPAAEEADEGSVGVPMPSTVDAHLEPLPSLDRATTPPTVGSAALALPSSPSYASRSLGRSVIVSGVEFEPALPALSPGLPPSPAPASYFDEWREQQQQTVETPPPTKEEMREFFSPAKMDGRPLDEEATPLEEQHDTLTLSENAEEATDVSFGADSSSFSSLSMRREREMAPSPSPAPQSPIRHPPLPTDDTQAAREARWSALVEQAEDRASRMGLDSLFEAEEDEEAEQSPVVETSISTSAGPSPASYTTSTMLYRLGLGSTSTLDGLASAPMPNRPSLVRVASTRTRKGGGLKAVRDWIRCGDETTGAEEHDSSEVWHIENGPSWRADIPPFTVVVHSPERRPSLGNRSEYTTYQLTTLFQSEPDQGSLSSSTSTDESITVKRRFSHFVALHSLLTTRYPILTIRDLPSRSFAGRFDPSFVETRRRDLERWLGRLGRSPVLRGCSELRDFLVIKGEKDLQALLAPSGFAPPSFFSRVFHPEFNVDPAEAQEIVERFERHVKASEMGGGAWIVETSLGRVRDSTRDLAESQLSLAHLLARLVAGQALPPSSNDTIANLGEDHMQAISEADESQSQSVRSRAWCMQTEDGAYSCREGDSALSTSKAVQASAEAVSQVALLQDGLARDDLLIAQELLREISHPHSQYTQLIDAHKLALAEHNRLTSEPEQGQVEEALARCETILNITSAEMEQAHIERTEDLRRVAEQLLDSQIAMHEQALDHLRFARSHFDPSSFAALARTGPRLHSNLEGSPPSALLPLPQPSSYGVPSPASAAVGVAQAVGSVLGRGLGRSNSTPNPSRAGRGVATAGTVGRMPKSLESTQSTRGKENLREEPEQPRGTWRASIFGTTRFW